MEVEVGFCFLGSCSDDGDGGGSGRWWLDLACVELGS